LLDKAAPKRKAEPINLETAEYMEKDSEITSLRCEEDLHLEEHFQFGSKKRMYLSK